MMEHLIIFDGTTKPIAVVQKGSTQLIEEVLTDYFGVAVHVHSINGDRLTVLRTGKYNDSHKMGLIPTRVFNL